MRHDADLVVAFRKGDEAAGEALVDRYYGRVLGFFRNKAPHGCSDLVQRTFLGCFESLERLREPKEFRRFLFGVACNQLRKHYDKGRRESEFVDYESVSSADLDPSPSQVITERQQQRVLLEALRRIPLQYQIVLELFFWEEMTAAQIASTLAIPVGTAKTRLRSGRKKLEQVITTLDAEDEVLTSTVSDLEGWAKGLRMQVHAGRVGG